MEDEPIEPDLWFIYRHIDWTLTFRSTVLHSKLAFPEDDMFHWDLIYLSLYTLQLERLSPDNPQYTVLADADSLPLENSLEAPDDFVTCQIGRDWARMFAGLENMDGKRALWSFRTSPDACDPVFKRFMGVSFFMENVVYELSECHECRAESRYCNKYRCLAKMLGNALWQVSCHVPRSLSPSPPPPPYTLHAFNIELPPIDFHTAKTRGYTVGRTLRVEKRKRSDPEDVGYIRKQRLLRFEGKSRVCPESTAPETQNSLLLRPQASTNQQA